MKKVKMTFEISVPLNIMIDEETLEKEYKGDIHKLAKFLYKEEGYWFDGIPKLVKTEIQ